MFVVAYLNNVLIYSKNKKDYKKHVQIVLNILKKNKVKLALSKAKWFKEEVKFLSLIVRVKGTRMLNDKLKAIRE